MEKKTTGEIIKELREQRGMSQEALAEAVGITRNYLAMIEINQRKGKFVIQKIADKLKVG
jgi:transcriptional regulator with XRE-family HTH domain